MPSVPSWVREMVSVRRVAQRGHEEEDLARIVRVDQSSKPIFVVYAPFRRNPAGEEVTEPLNTFVNKWDPIADSERASSGEVLLYREDFEDGSVVQLWRDQDGKRHRAREIHPVMATDNAQFDSYAEAEMMYLELVRRKRIWLEKLPKPVEPPPPEKKNRFDREDPL